MAVPENIRNVPRPKNTVVEDSGREGPNRYFVRERKQSVYIPGKNPSPRNGRVIGHIVDGQYIPAQTRTGSSGPDMLSYGACALVKDVSRDILEDLLRVYPADDAFAIMAIASLRAIKPNLGGNRMSTHYGRTYVSRYYPGVALSKNAVSSLYQRLGQDGDKRLQFYHQRLNAVAKNHHIAIDGTLKQNSSKVNDFSEFSYKSRIKGVRNVSILYAFDIELMEPVCCEVFPGNFIDASSYRSFIRDNGIQRGIIISDKGFPPSCIKEELEEHPDLHFLSPLRRNDTRITTNKMLEFEGVLGGIGKHILYKKRQIKGGSYLYAFMDADKAAIEECAFIARAEKGGNFDPAKYAKKDASFGTIVFESDLDLPPKVAYLCYEDRWMLELLFGQYKGDECLDQTNVQGDFSLIGLEFVNFIVTVLNVRMLHRFRNAGLLDKMSVGDVLDDLNSAWRKVDAPLPPCTGDGAWVHTLPSVFKELEALGLSTPEFPEQKKKRGRPKKVTDAVVPKRTRGRPRKNPVPLPE